MIKLFSNRVILLFIGIFAVLLFIPFLGNVNLFEGFEINFAESAREMLVTNNFLDIHLNFTPVAGASPFFIWLQALSMKIFGINEFASRFPNAICGVISLLVLYSIGRRLVNETFGIIWLLFFCSSFLPVFYFRTGTSTPWYTLFLFISIYYAFEFFITSQNKLKFKYLILSSVFIGLGALTKGIAVIFLFGLIVFIYLSIKMFKTKIKFIHVLWFLFISFFLIGVWLLLSIINGNLESVSGFFKYQFSHFHKLYGNKGFFLFHIIIVYLGVFPASIFAINIFKRQLKDDREPLYEFKNWMIISFWTIIVLFTIIRINIVQYSSLCYFSLSFLASYVVYKILYFNQPLSKWIRRLISTTAFFIGFTIVLMYLLSQNIDFLISSGIIKDPFILGNLQANVHWSGLEFFIGLIYIIVILSFYTLQKFSLQNKIFGTLIATIIFNYLIIIIVMPHYEKYRQGVVIDFYKEKSKEDCYVKYLGVMSYADLFYMNTTNTKKTTDKQSLLTDSIDKPVYFILRNKNYSKFTEKFPRLKIIDEKNGYVFLQKQIK